MKELTKQDFYHYIESGLFTIVGFHNPLDQTNDDMLDALEQIDQGFALNVGMVDVTKSENNFVSNFGLDEKSPPIMVIFKNDTKPKRAFKDNWNVNYIMKCLWEEMQPGSDEGI